MKYDLEPAKTILRTFLKEIEEVKAIRKQMSSPQAAQSFTIKDRMPVFDATEFAPAPDSDSFWEKEDAYIWLYADAWNFRALMHRPASPPISEYYSQLAYPLYQQWHMESKEVFHRKSVQIPEPRKRISLHNYLQSLTLIISEKNEHRDVWIESLRSFLQFLRDDTNRDQKGSLEVLFPSKESCKGMELRQGYRLRRQGRGFREVEARHILRSIEETVYPIDILAASEILTNLSHTVFHGRPNSQYSAAAALGFAWLCHAVGSYRLVTREDLLFATKIDSFRLPVSCSNPWIEPSYFIGIESLFGVINTPVSKTLYEFLLALPRDPNQNDIFNMDLDTISRTFREKGVNLSKRARHLGKITFLTFMSPPHEVIGHRAGANITRLKSRRKTVAHQAI